MIRSNLILTCRDPQRFAIFVFFAVDVDVEVDNPREAPCFCIRLRLLRNML